MYSAKKETTGHALLTVSPPGHSNKQTPIQPQIRPLRWWRGQHAAV